jgi:peptide/nickel transport system ATP-binding protein
MPLLEVRDFSLRFAGSDDLALHPLSFEVEEGEVLAVVGESGSGKSITSLALMGLLPGLMSGFPGGEAWLTLEDGTRVGLPGNTEQECIQHRGKAVAMVFQEPMTALNPLMTLGQQVMEAVLQHQPMSETEGRAKAMDWLQEVQLPDPETTFIKYPHEVSGGQKQRVMIAMALAGKPRLLIADEPTTALDVTVQKGIITLLSGLTRKFGMGMIFITHDLGLVKEVANRCLVLYKGKTMECQPTADLFLHPTSAYTKALLACRPISNIGARRLPVVSDWLSDGSPHALKPYSEPAPIGEALLSLEQLSVSYALRGLGKNQSRTVVHNVSLEVFQGETLGLVGESGCGKSTLGKAISGLVDPSGGSIKWKGQTFVDAAQKTTQSMQKLIQVVFQDPYGSLNPAFRIGNAIEEVLQLHQPNLNRTQRKTKAIELLEAVGLEASAHQRYPHAFSGGQRQRIVIARALAVQPQLLICDEAVSALDVSVQAQVLNLLNDLKEQFGLSLLFITHDLGVARYFCQRIAVMQSGRLVEVAQAQALFEHPQHPYTQQLLESIPGR